MLGKMLIHGLLAAALIGSAAAVYAQAGDVTQTTAMDAQGQPQAKMAATEPDKAQADNGYLRPTAFWSGDHDRDRDRGHGRHDRKRKHDHDDDDD